MPNANKIKARMRELGLTQADLGKSLGLATATVSQKINGYRPLTVEEAERMAEVLQIDDSHYASYFFAH